MFVKTHLKHLPQLDDVWEADFQPYPEPANRKCRRNVTWIGTVVSRTSRFILADALIGHPPTVKDFAGLLAQAMRRPMEERPHRPTRIHLRDNPLWEELLLHLKELRIEVVTLAGLSELDTVYEEFAGELKRKARK